MEALGGAAAAAAAAAEEADDDEEETEGATFLARLPAAVSSPSTSMASPSPSPSPAGVPWLWPSVVVVAARSMSARGRLAVPEAGGDPAAALEAYDAVRRPATAAIVAANRKGGPEGVIDFVEDRAPEGYEDVHDVATEAELRAIVGDYEVLQVAGR